MGRTSNARSRLLETAMQLMYARGYSAVGVQEICAQAGVNKGSFYHFFPSKQALILAVIEAHGQRLRHIWEDVMQVEEPWHERLHGCLSIPMKPTVPSVPYRGRCTVVRSATWPSS